MAVAAALVAVALLAAATADAQTGVPKVGFVSLPRTTVAQCQTTTLEDQFFQGLRELGYVVGQTIAVEFRCSASDEERAKVLAEFVRMPVEVIVVIPPAGALAAKKLTSTIPIVCASCGDPVDNGLAVSLARPGGNVTGLASLSAELIGKRIQILKELLPKLSRVAVFVFPRNPGTPPTLKALEAVGRASRLELELFEIRAAADFAAAFRAATTSRAGAVLIQDDPMVRLERARIAGLASEHRLPAITGLAEAPEAGLLMAYAPDRMALLRRSATFVDKILKGAKAGDLPFEQAAKYELIINMRTAETLGLTVPRSLQARADRLIR